MRAIIVALAALVEAGAALAQDLMSPRAFRDAVIARVRMISPDAKINVRDDRTFEIHGGGIANIDNVYTSYAADPNRRAELIERLARLATSSPGEPNRCRIVSILRPRDLLDQWRQVLREHKAEPLVWREFAGDLIVVLAFDGEETIRQAPRSRSLA